METKEGVKSESHKLVSVGHWILARRKFVENFHSLPMEVDFKSFCFNIKSMGQDSIFIHSKDHF